MPFSARSVRSTSHTPFEPHERGVQFEQVKASGKFQAISDVWDVEDFEAEVATVNEFSSFWNSSMPVSEHGRYPRTITGEQRKLVGMVGAAVVPNISSIN